MSSSTDQKPITIESVLEELSSSKTDPSMIVNPPNWNHIPLLIREWDGKDEALMCRLLDEMSRILTLISDSELPLANKRLLHSTLSALSHSEDTSKKVITRVRQCMLPLDSIQEGPLMILETDAFRAMEESLSEPKQTSPEPEKPAKKATDRLKPMVALIGKVERTKQIAEKEKETLNTEIQRMNDAFKAVKAEKVRTERENIQLIQALEDLKLKLASFTTWAGTKSLRTIDATVHTLAPTRLIQSKKLTDVQFRTAFTFPIENGEWELKVRIVDDLNVALGYHNYPLPDNATQDSCGSCDGGFGGDFTVWNGAMFQGKKLSEPKGTHKACERVGQTAAIRVNMSTREARLFVDDEEQPGIFTDIPSPLCLAISTRFPEVNQSVEVLWLKRIGESGDSMAVEDPPMDREEEQKTPVESTKEPEVEEANTDVVKLRGELREATKAKQTSEREVKKLMRKVKELKIQLENLPIWVGTEAIRTFDDVFHSLTPTNLIQISKFEKSSDWRTAFTIPISQGEWELKVRATQNILSHVSLGYAMHPLRDFATQESCGDSKSGIGGEFILWNGSLWQGGKDFKPAGTNKKCDQFGQTAAIRVNMERREARLFIDDEEQPGIFTDIPSPLRLGITTGFHVIHESVEVMWLKRLRF